MLSKRILVLVFVLVFLTLLVGCLPGTTPSPPKGVIGGRIMTPPGSETTKDITGWIPLANATVTLTDSEGVTHTVTTDENGDYTFTDIAVDVNTIITATGTVNGNTVIVKDVIPQAVAVDENYEAGIADSESTALALIVEELLEQGLDPGDIDLEGIQGSDNFNEVVEQVNSILEENGNVTTDPSLTNTIGNVAEDIINPPEPSPGLTPQPTPVFLTSIVVNPKTMTLFVGETEDIVSVTAHYSDGSTFVIDQQGNDCGYGSSDNSIAEVSVTGEVTAVAEGIATITVSYEDKTDTLVVTVNPILLTSIVVEPETMTLLVEKSKTINSITAHYNNGTETSVDLGDCIYASDDTNIATVSSNGGIEAITEGTAIITVIYNPNGITFFDIVEVEVISKLVIAEVNTMGRPQLLGTIKTDGFFVIFEIQAVGQANDGDEINTSKYYSQTNFDNEYFTISAVGKFLKYNMFSGNTTPYWGTSWGDATNPLPEGVTFSQVEDGDDFVYAVSMSYAVLGLSDEDTFPVQIKARDFNDDFVESYSGYVGFDGLYSQYRGLYITDTGIFVVTLP